MIGCGTDTANENSTTHFFGILAKLISSLR